MLLIMAVLTTSIVPAKCVTSAWDFNSYLEHDSRRVLIPTIVTTMTVNYLKKLTCVSLNFLQYRGTRLITTTSFSVATSTQNYLNIKHAHHFT